MRQWKKAVSTLMALYPCRVAHMVVTHFRNLLQVDTTDQPFKPAFSPMYEAMLRNRKRAHLLQVSLRTLHINI